MQLKVQQVPHKNKTKNSFKIPCDLNSKNKTERADAAILI